jgi:hypothetical protein
MARGTDPETSHLAAADASARMRGKHETVLRMLLEAGPLTDFELALGAHAQQTSIGKRRGECRDQGWVEPDHVNGVPVRRKAPSGSLAQVWRITDKGREALRGSA